MADSFAPIANSPARQGEVGVRSEVAVNGTGSLYGWANEDEKALYNKWANMYTGYEDGLKSYFDYYFTGQDVQVYIDGLFTAQDRLPIYQFGYAVQQEKRPLYGFWSYTWDAMLRGTRVVSGAFTVVFVKPDLVKEKVAKAAKVRAEKASDALFPIRGLDEDEANVQNYWRRHFDSNLDVGQQHLFSIHPPFNLIIVYGLQETSLDPSADPSARAAEIRYKYRQSSAMMSDINERLVEADTDDNKMRVLLENVELTSKQTEFNSEGDPILETYSFLARDMREAPVSRKTTGNSLIQYS